MHVIYYLYITHWVKLTVSGKLLTVTKHGHGRLIL